MHKSARARHLHLVADIQQEFAEDVGTPPEDVTMEGDLLDLCSRYEIPHAVTLFILEQVMDVLRPLGRLRTLAQKAETDGHVQPGFDRDLQMLIALHLSLLAQGDQ